jgi:hypothetical protein
MLIASKRRSGKTCKTVGGKMTNLMDMSDEELVDFEDELVQWMVETQPDVSYFHLRYNAHKLVETIKERKNNV